MQATQISLCASVWEVKNAEKQLCVTVVYNFTLYCFTDGCFSWLEKVHLGIVKSHTSSFSPSKCRGQMRIVYE